MRTATLLVIASVLSCAAAQAGDVYKFTDPQGRTHYTDKPIPGAERVSTGVQRPPEAAAQAYAQQQNNQNRQLTDSNQRIAAQDANQRAQEQVAKDLDATRAERCQKAQANYDAQIQSRRLYKDNPDGSRTYLSESEMAAARVNAAKNVEQICGQKR